MKTIAKLTLVLFVLIAFQSCSKDDAPAPVANSQPAPEPTPETESETEPNPEPEGEANETEQNALHFDGIDDYVLLDTLANSLSLRQEITVEFLVKIDAEDNKDEVRPAMFAINPASPGQNKVLIVLGSQDTEEYTGKLTIYEAGTPAKFLTSEARIDDGICHHIGYVRTQTQVEAFLDGVSMGTFDITEKLESTDRISIGQEWDMDMATGFFKGTIDELRIWRIARTTEELKLYMNAELPELSEDLLSYYTFNQGTAAKENADISMLLDATPDKFDGELIGFDLAGNTSNFINSECIEE